MKKYILYTILIITVLTSCRKEKDNMHGMKAGIYVKQYKTNTPIANAMVLITRGVPGSGVGSQIVDTLYTDANGRVAYNKKVDENYMYYAEAYKDGYFDTHNQQVDVRPGEKNFTTTIFMYAHSWVKLHVKNVNPYDQFDLLRISTSFYQWNFSGLNIDTTILYADYGYEFMADFTYIDACVSTKNNIDSTIIFTYTPPPHDTITVDINY
jgi:hypothetical protein